MLNQPHHVRKKVALICTGIIAVVLVAIMILYYAKQKGEVEVEKTTVFKDFYNTILQKTNSLLKQN